MILIFKAPLLLFKLIQSASSAKSAGDLIARRSGKSRGLPVYKFRQFISPGMPRQRLQRERSNNNLPGLTIQFGFQLLPGKAKYHLLRIQSGLLASCYIHSPNPDPAPIQQHIHQRYRSEAL
jgi:hypothetical protein